MKITFDPPDLATTLEEPLLELIQSSADEMARGRCAPHGAAPVELRVVPGSGGNVVDFDIAGCCEEYELPDEEE